MRTPWVDPLIGLGLQLAAFGAQFGAYAAALALGVPLPYESAPDNPGAAPGWLDQISLTMTLAAPLLFAVSAVAGWLLGVTSPRDGAIRGAIWTLVVVACHVLIGVGNQTTAMLAAPGLWLLFLGCWLGPVVAGWWRERERQMAARL